MAEKEKKKPARRKRAQHEVLDFERPIVELEEKIEELEALSHDSDLNLNGEIKPLRNRLAGLIEEVFADLSPWQQVQVARAPSRPLAIDYMETLCDEYMELHGDRSFRDDRSVLTALARIGEHRFMVVAHRKGRDTKQKIAFNFGCAHPEGYRKALRKMRLAEKFGIPIICLINTPGAYPGIGAEERGQAWAIAENLMGMFSIRVPIICVVIGEGGSGGALGIGIGDRILMLDHAYYSVISPEGCAAILWKDAKKAPDAAEALKISARDLKELGVIDEIVKEPDGAAHRNPQDTMAMVKARVMHHLQEVNDLPIDDLLALRYEKFRLMGTLFGEPEVPKKTENPEGEAEEAAALSVAQEPAEEPESPEDA